jgi:hypothetical protein
MAFLEFGSERIKASGLCGGPFGVNYYSCAPSHYTFRGDLGIGCDEEVSKASIGGGG